MRKIYLLIALIAVSPLCLLAQQKIIRGQVTDIQSGSPLQGVTISINNNGNNASAITDATGNYSINAPTAATQIVFSFVGMKELVENINGRNTINVRLTSENTDMGEVVVVGYGSKRKETLTGSVSNITNRDIQTTTNVGLAQKLQGKVAGLQIRQLGGEPGTFNNMINIRGFGRPLYVIDGVLRNDEGDFQRLNADDIESISFLKDASAAIYGFNAASGVVIVTTKKGSKGKTSFGYTGVLGIMKPTDVPRMANAAEWMQMRNDAALLGTGSPFITQEELQKWIDGAPGYENTDWYSAALKNSTMQHQHNVSATGGNERTQYYIGFGFADEQSLLKSGDMGYRRYNLRTNLTTKLTDNLKAEVLIGGFYDKREVPGENFFNIFKGTRITLPTEKPYANNNSQYPAVVSSGLNPLALSQRDITGYGETVNRKIQSSVALTYDVPFVRGLSLKGLASYDISSYEGKDVSKPFRLYNYIDEEYIALPQRVGTGFVSNNYGDFNQLTLQGQANYAVSIGEHNIQALGVVEQQQRWNRDGYLQRFYSFYTNDQVNNASDAEMRNSGMESREAFQSLLGRFNYDFSGKYLVEFAFRYMGNYRYPPDTRWGFFPVVSAGWRVSEENFMKSIPAISNLKFRASYGKVGEEAGAPFQYIPGFSTENPGQYEFANGTNTRGLSAPAIVNPTLTWVTATTTDIGMDVGLWNNKLSFEVDVYRRDREGLLALRNVSLPNTFGATLPQENLNSDRVQGIEFTISHNNRVGEFSYGISTNFNYSRTKRLYIEETPYLSSYSRWRNGQSNRYDDIVWGYTYAGQFQSYDEITTYPLQNGDQANVRELPGDFKYEDVNNDGVIDGRDELPIFIGAVGNNDDQNAGGRKNPKINFGFSVNAAYKGFDINMLIQGSAIYTVRFSEVYAEVLAFRGNTPAYFADRWHLSDPYNPKSEWVPGKWPASRFIADVGGMYKESSIWRKDASYARLKSLEIGYTIPARLYRGSGLNKIRVYASGFNLFTIADPFVKAFDPERLEGLFNAGFNYPLMKTYNFGVNLNF